MLKNSLLPVELWEGAKRLLGKRGRRVAARDARAFIELRLPEVEAFSEFSAAIEAELRKG